MGDTLSASGIFLAPIRFSSSIGLGAELPEERPRWPNCQLGDHNRRPCARFGAACAKSMARNADICLPASAGAFHGRDSPREEVTVRLRWLLAGEADNTVVAFRGSQLCC